MLRSVLTKTLRDDRRSLMWWAVGLSALAAWTIGMYGTYAEGASELTKFWEKAPEAMKALFGGELDLGTAAGYLRVEVFSLTVPLLLMIFGIGAGARAIAAEERRGTLDLLLSYPVSRRRVAVEKLGAVVVSTIFVGTVLTVAILVGIQMAGMDISLGNVVQAAAMAVALGVFFGALAFAVGASTGRRGVAVGVAAVVGVLGYLVFGMSAVIEGLKPWRWAMPWTYYAETDTLRQGATLWHAAVLIATASAAALVAVHLFSRRDVGT